jgi:hypothetical protein
MPDHSETAAAFRLVAETSRRQGDMLKAHYPPEHLGELERHLWLQARIAYARVAKIADAAALLAESLGKAAADERHYPAWDDHHRPEGGEG